MLAKEAKINLSKTSKAAGQIAKMTELFDAKISSLTVERKLKAIPEALERRGKTPD